MRPNSPICETCQCRFEDGSCVHIVDRGPNEPLQAEFILSQDQGQLAECGPAGFGVFLPPYLLDPPAVQVYRTVNQTIPFEAAQIIYFNAEVYDTDSMHESGDNLSRLVFKTAGIYLVTFNVRWNKIAADSGDVAAFIMKNGAEFVDIDSMKIADPDLYNSHSLSIELAVQAGEFIEGVVKQDAVIDDVGKPLAVIADYGLPHLSACFLRPLP